MKRGDRDWRESVERGEMREGVRVRKEGGGEGER